MHFNLLVIYLLANVQLNQQIKLSQVDPNVCSNLKQPQQFVIAATNFSFLFALFQIYTDNYGLG